MLGTPGKVIASFVTIFASISCTPKMNSKFSDASSLNTCDQASLTAVDSNVNANELFQELSNGSLQIIGGEELKIESLSHELAAVVEIRSKFTDENGVVNGMGYCTGSLIGRDLVLTAAHCVSKPRSLSGVTVYVVPQKDQNGRTEKSLFSSEAVSFVSHTDYSPQEPGSKMPEGFQGQNDLALIRLANAVPADVPYILVGDMLFETKFDGTFLISGHGVSTESDSASRLHRKKEHVFAVAPGFSNNWFDIESKEKVQMCVGDSGGPLLIRKSDKLFLVGVFESAPACSSTEDSEIYVSRMTRAGAYFDWISSRASMDSPETVSMCSKKVFKGENGIITKNPGKPADLNEMLAATPLSEGAELELLGVRWFEKKHYALVNATGVIGYIPYQDLKDSAVCPAAYKTDVTIKYETVAPPVFLKSAQNIDATGCVAK